MTKSSKGTPPSRIPELERRELVQHYVRLHGTTSPTYIMNLIRNKTKKNINRKTIKDDINVLMAENRQWVTDQTEEAWSEKCRQMYIETNEEITQLQKLNTEMINAPREIHPQLLELLETEEDPKVAAALARHLADLYTAVAPTNISGKVAYVTAAINEKRKLLVDIMTDKPLYDRMEKLALSYSEHIKKENR